MGAALSLPFLALPGVGALTSCVGSCAGYLACSAVSSGCGMVGNYVMPEIGHAVLLLVNSLLSWLMLTDWAFKKLQNITFDYMDITCNGKECYGFVAVHRINFALCLFHVLLLSIIMMASGKGTRKKIQSGFWGPKILAWLTLVVLSFFIPEGFFVFWGNYIAFFGSVIFLFIGLLLFVDLAYGWTTWCEERERTDLLAYGSIFFYVCSIVISIVMYAFFAHSGCSMNQAVITVNLILMVIVSAISVNPEIRYNNHDASLSASSVVALYCTYLTLSAVSMEPDDKQCNPLLRGRGTRTTSIVIGAVMTFLTLAFTTLRAANSLFQPTSESQSAEQDVGASGYSSLPPMAANDRESRRRIMQQAVDEGSMPASELETFSDSDSDSVESVSKGRFSSNYPKFHLIFILSAMWVGTLLTMNVNPQEHEGEFVAVGRTYWASWVKIISAWVCYVVYGATLVLPTIMPERFRYHYQITL